MAAQMRNNKILNYYFFESEYSLYKQSVLEWGSYYKNEIKLLLVVIYTAIEQRDKRFIYGEGLRTYAKLLQLKYRPLRKFCTIRLKELKHADTK